MRFGFIHRIMTDALATLGLLALVTSGELSRIVAIGLLVGLVLALALPDRWQDKPLVRRLSVFAPLGLFIIEAVRLGAGANFLEVAVEFAAGLQVIRLGTRRGAAHDQQVVVLALIHLIAGTVLGGGLAYGLCFAGFLVVAPGALVLSHLRREVEGNYRQGARDRTGLPVDVPRILRSRRVIGKSFLALTCLLSVPIFLFTAILFVLFPRVGLSLLLLNHARPERMIGFSDRVDLGGVGRLRADPTIAMRVAFPSLPTPSPARLALYLRGTAFDYYDGRSWARTTTHRHVVDPTGGVISLAASPPPDPERYLSIDLEPIDPPVLFLPTEALALRIHTAPQPLLPYTQRIFAGPEDQYQYHSPDERGIRYQVYLTTPPATPAPSPLGPHDRARYLRLPPDLPPRIAELARTWTAKASHPAQLAQIIQNRLRTEYRYDLASPSGAAQNPLDHFLFESRRGHCEFYSTAMAILLRTLQVPTRNVTGFIGGTYNKFGGYYAVRQGDAHSWVEVYIDGSGWTRFDPTPPASAVPQSELTGVLALVRDVVEAAAQRWNHHVRGYDLKQQLHLLTAVRTQLRHSTPRTLHLPRERLLQALLGALLVAAGLYCLRRIRIAQPAAPPGAGKSLPETDQLVALYRTLDQAMAVRGVPRPAGTPPYAHARALTSLNHPIAPEVLALTNVYLEARFGPRTLTAPDVKDFAKRVRLLRSLRTSQTHRPPPPPA